MSSEFKIGHYTSRSHISYQSEEQGGKQALEFASNDSECENVPRPIILLRSHHNPTVKMSLTSLQHNVSLLCRIAKIPTAYRNIHILATRSSMFFTALEELSKRANLSIQNTAFAIAGMENGMVGVDLFWLEDN